MNILIIEDEQMLRRALIYNLIEAGHMVAACSNGQEGISRVEKNPHLDVIICDVMMPVLSGPGFILMLKK
jgi:CheY-like chemotaxis protein